MAWRWAAHQGLEGRAMQPPDRRVTTRYPTPLYRLVSLAHQKQNRFGWNLGRSRIPAWCACCTTRTTARPQGHRPTMGQRRPPGLGYGWSMVPDDEFAGYVKRVGRIGPGKRSTQALTRLHAGYGHVSGSELPTTTLHVQIKTLHEGLAPLLHPGKAKVHTKRGRRTAAMVRVA